MSDIVRIGDATLYHGDAREMLPLQADRLISDPVWPTAPIGACPGADGKQQELLDWVLWQSFVRTAVIVLGFDCDPRFLTAVPNRLPFIRSQQLPYAFPGYRGRLLAGDEVAYAFGEIPKRGAELFLAAHQPRRRRRPRLRMVIRSRGRRSISAHWLDGGRLPGKRCLTPSWAAALPALPARSLAGSSSASRSSASISTSPASGSTTPTASTSCSRDAAA